MILLRKSEDRGHADHGWLDSRHTFSFASYYDPDYTGFRSLRVINEDRVAPGKGFGTHGHDNMEIISYVLEGALEHADSMGNGKVLEPGEFQRISAGSGITHSEFNPSLDSPVHFYQIWLLPDARDIEPSYEQKRFDDVDLSNDLRLVASPTGADGSISINQDARIFLAKPKADGTVGYDIPAGRHLWLQMLRGSADVNQIEMKAGDGAAISDEEAVEITARNDAEIMLFDLA